MPSFFQVAVLSKFDPNMFFFSVQRIATQEAAPYSRTSFYNILDDAEIKSLMQDIILEYKYYFWEHSDNNLAIS